ncbi:glycine cleavage system protein T [Halobacteriales archaeon SW_7_68_16]|nr:MAG: glycine cleavage system protein T [Halobacteriales archaeon SW_7_68_16]
MALRTPPLRSVHAGHGAKFTEFGGWDMPVEYDSIRAEHAAVRESVGRFDVSHMGQIEVAGPDAARLLSRLLTVDVTDLDPGRARYGALTTDAGVLIDDTVVSCLRRDGRAAPGADDLDAPAGEGPDRYLFVPNAGHDAAIHDRVTTHRDEWGLDATVSNRTADTAMVAIQGPDAVGRLGATIDAPVADLDRFGVRYARVGDVPALISRTGYTGEDGVEILAPPAGFVADDAARSIWSAVECQPCGIGARDTLRLEAGLLLSGQDFHPEEDPRTPYEAGIGFAVDPDHEFVGRAALADATEPDERLVGFRLTERGVPRNGYDVTDTDGTVIGRVTSGTMSPTLDEPIGLASLPVSHTDPGTSIRVVVRGRQKQATVVDTPFL